MIHVTMAHLGGLPGGAPNSPEQRGSLLLLIEPSQFSFGFHLKQAARKRDIHALQGNQE